MKITEEWSILQALYRFWSVLSIQSESIVRRDLGDRRINRFKFWQILIPLATTSGVIVSGNSAIAQIVPDRTLGKESSIVTPNVDIKGVQSDRIDGGAIRGSALFHSFQEFSIGEGRGGYFSNPSGIENIFSRVTGINASNIYGKLGVLGNANLFLLNPNGIIFGPNASLDLNGSFLGSTGNSFNFGNGKEFSASNPTAPPLLSVSVPLGVQFNQKQPSAIANLGNLSTKQNLTLLGGTVASTGQLSAPEGQIAVAAVPSGSVVNLSSTGQFQNIDTSSALGAGNSASLTKLLTSMDERSRLGLTVNNNGQVELSGSGLPVVDGDVVAKNVIAQTATLTAHHNLTLVESQIGTNGDLNLLAGDTVRIRDSVANPFVAQAGGNLLVQGRQGVDIFALNNSSSGLVSGRDMVLRSANTVGGDAHYWAGGNFRIEQLDGSLGGLFSPYDPIIRAAGDVSFDSYTGGSLHILAGGSVKINGNVEITGTDATNGLIESNIRLSDDTLLQRKITLTDGSSETINGIDGTRFSTLDIRAGVRADAIAGTPIEGSLIPVSELTGIPDRNEITSLNRSDNEPTSANIEIGSIVNTKPNAQVFLTNQYRPNSIAESSIKLTGGILRDLNNPMSGSFSIITVGSPVTIDSRGEVQITQGIITGIATGQGGDINILSKKDVQIGKGNNGFGAGLSSVVNGGAIDENNRSGNITITSTDGKIETNGNITTFVSSGISGDIKLQAKNDIIIANEIASRILNDKPEEQGNAGKIQITSDSGNIKIENSVEGARRAIESSTPHGKGGDITLEASQGKITASSEWKIVAESKNGVAGDVTLTALGNIQSPNIIASSINNLPSTDFADISITSSTGTVFIDNTTLNTTNTGNSFAGDISINGRDIQITDSSSIKSQGVVGRIDLTANGGKVTISNKSVVDTQTINGVTTTLEPSQGEGISIKAGQIEINNSSLTAQTNSEAPPGSITLDAISSVDITNGSNIFNTVSKDANVQQVVADYTPIISFKGSSVKIINSQVSASTFGIGNAGNIIIDANNEVTFDNANAFATVEAGAIGKGGYISISIPTGSLFVTNGAQLQALTKGQGDAGNVIINARDIFFDGNGSSVFTKVQGNLQIQEGQERRRGGNITITTGSLSVTNGAQLLANTEGTGDAGNIIINATNYVNISGTSPISGRSSALFTSTEPGSIGTGGNITVGNEVRPNIFHISDGAVLFTSTSNNFNAGKIEINANRFEAINGGQLIAKTTSSGAAGTISVTGGRRVTVSGRDANFADRRSKFGNGVVANIVSDDPHDPEVFSGLFVNSETTTASAGNIVVSSPIVFLDDHGRLIAESSGGDGGDITLKDGTLLLLRRNSLISTTAGKEGQPGNGGKININYPEGFVIAGFRRNNDIAADAFKDFGGKVTITALGAVNIDTLSFLDLKHQFPPGTTAANLNPQLLPTNDATANSLTNPNGGGIVEINAPNIDPTRGTIQLPEDLGDSSKLIAQSCRVGVQGAANSFIVTGRGGLPSSPNSALSTDTFLGSAANTSSEQTTSIPLPLREAQGVEIGSGGEIILTAHPSTLTPHTPWQRLNSCNGQ